MTRTRRRLLVGTLVVALVALAAGGGWELWQLEHYNNTLAYGSGVSGGDVYRIGRQYQIPDAAYGPYAGRMAEVMPVGGGSAWLGYTLVNSGDYAVTITGLAAGNTSDPAGHLRVAALLSPNGYQGPPDDGMPGLGNPLPYRTETVQAHQQNWIGFRFTTTNCDGITGPRRFVIGKIAIRISYAHLFTATEVLQPPWVVIATCGPFHPVLYP